MRWFELTPSKVGHDPDDSECIFWAGDFAGVNLRVVCEICKVEPDDPAVC